MQGIFYFRNVLYLSVGIGEQLGPDRGCSKKTHPFLFPLAMKSAGGLVSGQPEKGSGHLWSPNLFYFYESSEHDRSVLNFGRLLPGSQCEKYLSGLFCLSSL